MIEQIEAIREQKKQLQKKLEVRKSDLLYMTRNVDREVQNGNRQGHYLHKQIIIRKDHEVYVAKLKYSHAGKQHLAKKYDPVIIKKELKLDEVAHFKQNKYVYDIVASALNGNAQNRAAIVSFLVHLCQKQTAKTDISSISMKSKKIEEEFESIKVQFNGLIEFIAPKECVICMEIINEKNVCKSLHKCDHDPMFHDACIQTYFQVYGFKCPYCRVSTVDPMVHCTKCNTRMPREDIDDHMFAHTIQETFR